MTLTPGPASSPFGTPLDPALLEEPVAAKPRARPVRTLAAIGLPLISFAAAVVLQRLVEGALAQGDAAGRWLALASLIGAVLGAGCGVGFGRKLIERVLWPAWGALAPLLIVAFAIGGARAIHPVRESLSERAATTCRATRKICSVNEFRANCSALEQGPAARALAEANLGVPEQKLCGSDGCTSRWLYAGPWTPDNWSAPGSILCSEVVDAAGRVLRSALGPGPERP